MSKLNNISNICGLRGCTIKGKSVIGLDAIIDRYQAKISKFRKEVQLSKQAAEEGEMVYEDKYITIIHPTTEAASCYYGRGTKWCTAALVSDNMFNLYNDDGPMYIITPKKPKHTGEKYQLHLGSGSLMDEKDEEVAPRKFLETYPSLYEVLPSIIERIPDDSTAELVGALAYIMGTDLLEDVLSKLDVNVALEEAVRLGHVETARLLLERGANISKTMITIAANLETILLLVEHGADVTTILNEVTLGRKIVYNKPDIVKFLIDSGVEINTKKDNPLSVAAEFGRLEIAKLLLDHGAIIPFRSVHLAAIKDRHNIVKLLLDRGGNPYALPEKFHKKYASYFKIFEMRWQKICRHLNKEHKLSELREMARFKKIPGLSKLNKRELCQKLAME